MFLTSAGIPSFENSGRTRNATDTRSADSDSISTVAFRSANSASGIKTRRAPGSR